MKRKVLTSAFLLLIIIAIISCSSNDIDSQQFAGIVNGQKIDRALFTTNFLFKYNDLTKGNKNYQASNKEINRLEEETWDEIVKNVIISQFVKAHKIEVSQEEVIDSLLMDPPHFLKESGYFDTKGVFDIQKYKSSIQKNEPVNTEFIKFKYQQQITYNKIKNELVKNADISASDVERYYKKNYASSDIVLLKMQLDNFQPTVTNAEIDMRWRNDKKEYFYTPSLDIKYVLQYIQPSKEEISQTKATIDSLYFKLAHGGDFDSAVLEFSSNLNLYPLGKMPFLKLEDIPEIIRSYVSSAKIGDVISPVSKKNVWYIYKVIDKTKSMVKLQELKHPVQIGQNTILQRREEFMQVNELIQQIGIEQTAFEYNWEVYSAHDLNMNRNFVENLGDLTDLIKDAYDKEDGYLYPPIYNKGERFLVIVQIERNRLNKKKELDLVYSDIKNQILKEKQYDIVANKLRDLAEKYPDVKDETIDAYQWEEIKDVNKDSQLIKEINSEFIEDILSLSSQGDYTRCYTDSENGYLAILAKRNIADKTYFKKNFYVIQGEYRNNALNNYFSTWLEKEIENAKVKKWFNMSDLYKGKKE